MRTAELIPGANLLLLADMGHDMPEPLWPVIVAAIADSTPRRADAATGPTALPTRRTSMAGPLTGYRIIEIAGIGPGPFAAMLLADMGAEVIRVERAQIGARPGAGRRRTGRLAARPAQHRHRPQAPRRRGDAARPRRAGRRAHRGLPPRRDGAPRRRARRVPRPQPEAGVRADDRVGPGRPVRAMAAGHDINYISLAGALAHFGRARRGAVPPLNMVGDFGGGGMFLAFGVVCALLEAQKQRPGPGRRHGDGRRHGGADDACSGR